MKKATKILTFVTFHFQAPAVDVVAIGLADGRIILHNLRFDETLMTFTQDWGPVISISFRTGLCVFYIFVIFSIP